ncbi:hypothetical protein CPAR01_05647 [Colletotrichum paranaense]|uniref:Uncharacterized protein n=1 Tax=Colletotrichum paranaense TaxID=1914294 RepID=A0ABQ9SRY1_9PEZI|nr:uncharacterized protein CPAR01_05647 [Colletotrichum paranaense]KAK1542260.1 hypothetical protein CPAR01_05647 [Colletotrichum paranaense]
MERINGLASLLDERPAIRIILDRHMAFSTDPSDSLDTCQLSTVIRRLRRRARSRSAPLVPKLSGHASVLAFSSPVLSTRLYAQNMSVRSLGGVLDGPCRIDPLPRQDFPAYPAMLFPLVLKCLWRLQYLALIKLGLAIRTIPTEPNISSRNNPNPAHPKHGLSRLQSPWEGASASPANCLRPALARAMCSTNNGLEADDSCPARPVLCRPPTIRQFRP